MDKKRRILFLTTNDFGFGGSEDLWIQAAIRMKSQGIEVAASVRDWMPAPRLLQELKESGCKIFFHQIPHSRDDIADIIEFTPDLVIVSNGYFLEGLSWLQGFSQAGIPYVVVIQCVHEAGWPHMDEASIEFLNKLHREARRLYFVSHGNRELYERMTGGTPANAALAINPFKVDYGSGFFWPESEFIELATVGRIECFHKGLDLLISAFSEEKWKGRPVRLNIYGNGPHKHLLEKQAANSAKINVRFCGHTDSIEAVWARNHVLLQPSRLEGLPLSVVEAMLCGRPVLATDLAGHPEVIADSHDGFLAESASVKAISRALDAMWEKRAHLREMGQAAYRLIRAKIPRDPVGQMVGEFIALLDESRNSGISSKRRPATVRQSKPPAPHGANHHAHLFFAEAGKFNEEQKLVADYPAGETVSIRFISVHGALRFDPSANVGRFEIVKARAWSTEETFFDAETARELSKLFCAEGDAVKIPDTGTSLVFESKGNDPQLRLVFTPRNPLSPYNFEITMRAV